MEDKSCKTMKKRMITTFMMILSLTMFVQTLNVFADDQTPTEETTPSEETISSDEDPLDTEVNDVAEDAFILVSNTFDEIQVGDSAKFDVLFNLNGKETTYKNVVLTISLPQNIDDYNIIFDYLEDLSVKGIIPQYNINEHLLTYNFGDLFGGFEMVKTFEIKTRNGMNPDNNDLHLMASLTSDDMDQPLVSESVINLQATKNVSLSNKFSHNENAFVKNVVRYLDTFYYDVSVSVNRFNRGSIEVDKNHPVILEYTIPLGMQYLGNDSGFEPEVDGNTLRWVLSSDLNRDDAYCFVFNSKIKLKLIAELPLFQFSETVASISVPFINGESLTEEKIARTMVSPNDEQDEIQSIGAGYPTLLRGPSNDKGSVGGTANLDINVTDGALLGWVISAYANTATSPYSGFNAYDLFYHQDPNLALERFYSGDFYFRPNSKYPNLEKLSSDIFYSLSVRYTDSDEWVRLKEDIRPSTFYTVEELGIDEERTVETLWMHFHDNKSDNNVFVNQVGRHKEFDESYFSIPAGFCTPNMWFYTKIKNEYIGRVENKIGVAYSGWNTNDNRTDYRSEYVPSELISSRDMHLLPASWLAYTKPKSANIVMPPEGINRYIKAAVSLSDTKHNIVEPGIYNLNVTLENDESSLRSFNGPFETYLILPEGMSLVDAASNQKISIVDDNYRQQHETLVKIIIPESSIRVGGRKTITLPISIDDTAAYIQRIRFLGYLNQDFNVATTSNSYGYYTQKITDELDLNQNDNYDESLFITENAYTFKSAYDFYGDSSYNFENISNNKANYTLTLNVYNDKNTRVSDFVLIETLPGINDSKILDESNRNSRYDISLNNPLVLSGQQAALFDVYYSTSSKPEIKGMIDAHVATKYPKLQLPTADVNSEWLKAEDVINFDDIKSILITLKPHQSFMDNIQTFELDVSAQLIGKDEDAQTSFNTFAFAVNDILPLETISVPLLQINKDRLISVESQELEYRVNSVVTLDQFYEDLGLKIFADTKVSSTFSNIDFSTVGDYDVIVHASDGEEEEIINVLVHIIPDSSQLTDDQESPIDDDAVLPDNSDKEIASPQNNYKSVDTSADQTYLIYIFIISASLFIVFINKKRKQQQ